MSVQRAYPFPNRHLLAHHGRKMRSMSATWGPELAIPATATTEIAVVDYASMPSRFPVQIKTGEQKWSKAEQFMLDNMGWHIMSQLNEFGLQVRGHLEDLQGRLERGHTIEEYAKHLKQYMVCFMRLGDRESDGFVNLALQWKFEEDEADFPRIVMVFTLVDAAPSTILLKKDWDGQHQPLARWVNSGRHAVVTETLFRSGWTQAQRAKVLHLLTCEIKIPLEEVKSQSAQFKIGDIVSDLVVNLKQVLKVCGRRLELEKILCSHSWTALSSGRWLQRPCSFLLAYKERAHFLNLCADNWIPCSAEEVSPAGQAQWTQISRVLEQCVTLVQSTWHGNISNEKLWKAWKTAREKCGAEIPVSSSFIGLGVAQIFMRVEGTTIEEEEVAWLCHPSRIGPKNEVQFAMKLRRHYFQHLRVSIKTGAGIYACQPNGDCGDDAWMLGNYASSALGSQNTCFPDLVGQSHDRWWGDALMSTGNTPLELRRRAVYQLRMELQHGEGDPKPQHVIAASMLFPNALDVKLAFEVILAHMNARAMMLHLENQIFDAPYKLDHIRQLIRETTTVDRRRVPRTILEFMTDRVEHTPGLDTHEYWQRRFGGDLRLAPIHFAELVERNDKKRRQREFATRERRWKRIRLFQENAGLVPSPFFTLHEVQALEATAEEEDLLSEMLAAGANQEEQDMGEVMTQAPGEQDYDEDDDGVIDLALWNGGQEPEEYEESEEEDEDDDVQIVDDFDNNSVETVE